MRENASGRDAKSKSDRDAATTADPASAVRRSADAGVSGARAAAEVRERLSSGAPAPAISRSSGPSTIRRAAASQQQFDAAVSTLQGTAIDAAAQAANSPAAMPLRPRGMAVSGGKAPGAPGAKPPKPPRSPKPLPHPPAKAGAVPAPTPLYQPPATAGAPAPKPRAPAASSAAQQKAMDRQGTTNQINQLLAERFAEARAAKPDQQKLADFDAQVSGLMPALFDE